MEYTNSSLVKYTCLSPNHSGERTHAIDRITIHCVVGQSTMENLGALFARKSRGASSNYGVCVDGIAMFVEEKNRSWCSSSNANDQRAITIETASDTTEPYGVSDDVYKQLLELVYDICKRNCKTKLLWFNDKTIATKYEPQHNEMVLTLHKWFGKTDCPGTWLIEHMQEIADKTTSRLNNTCVCEFWNGYKCTKEETNEDVTIDVGDVVQIVGTKYYSGKTIPQWVKNKQWIVYSIQGNKIIINESTDGKNQIMSPVHINDLKLIKNK